AFTVGVDAGQLVALIVIVPVLVLLFRFVVAERAGTIVLSAFVAHASWHLFSQRFTTLLRFRFQWPVGDAAFLALVIRWAMLGVILVGAFWLLANVARQPTLRHRDL